MGAVRRSAGGELRFLAVTLLIKPFPGRFTNYQLLAAQ
jgi:hypothetical protein